MHHYTVYEDAANELNELRIAKARDDRAAAVMEAQERRAALNEERAVDFARRREAAARREAEETSAAHSQMEMKMSTVRLYKCAVFYYKTFLLPDVAQVEFSLPMA